MKFPSRLWIPLLVKLYTGGQKPSCFTLSLRSLNKSPNFFSSQFLGGLLSNEEFKLINNEYELKVIKPKIILINPTTRIKEKNIRKEDLFIILNELNKCNYKIYLIDIENKYKQFEKDVDIYLSSTTLDDVKELILISDLYIGADSFLIHLAYYLKRNYFILFYKDNEYFLPPNVQKDFYLKITKELNIRNEIIHKFTNIGLIK